MLNQLVDVVALSQLHCTRPILCELKYATADNFLGRLVEGYCADAMDVGLLTKKAAHQLCKAQNYFVENHGLSIFIYDSLRPLRAVSDFTQWMKEPPVNEYELVRKNIHYPHLEKHQLGALGYIAQHVSRHCFGNVVDMSLVKLDDGSLLEMGALFDFFDDQSHATATIAQIGETAFYHRQHFFQGMAQFGFHVYEKEFWHFEYETCEVAEPIDLVITAALRGLNVV